MKKQFPDVSCRYGAPMGRREDCYLETTEKRFVRLFRVRLDSGGYDDGGAYWGHGPALWCAEDDDGNRQFVRAVSRESAALLLNIPNPALKRRMAADIVRYGLAILDGRAPMPKAFHNGMPMTRDDVSAWMRATGCYFDGTPVTGSRGRACLTGRHIKSRTTGRTS